MSGECLPSSANIQLGGMKRKSAELGKHCFRCCPEKFAKLGKHYEDGKAQKLAKFGKHFRETSASVLHGLIGLLPDAPRRLGRLCVSSDLLCIEHGNYDLCYGLARVEMHRR